MNIVGWSMMCVGAMLLAGEYLCVEVAWRCLDYNQLYIVFAALMVCTGLTFVLMRVRDD